MLLDRGANVNARANDGMTPLHQAAARGNTATAALLIDRGAEIDARGDYDLTPLHVAKVQGHAEVAELLLSKGAEDTPPPSETLG